MLQQQISDIKAFSEAIWTNLQTFDEAYKQNLNNIPAEIASKVANIRATAGRTLERATTPFKIGIAGNVSTGKSILVECLVGWSGFLETGNTACTGNITNIVLIPSDEVAFPEEQYIKITYLTLLEVKECLHSMLENLSKLNERGKSVQTTDLSGSLKELMEELKRIPLGELKQAAFYLKVRHWCSKNWNGYNDRDWKYALKEVWNFCETCRACAHIFCSEHARTEYEISRSLFKSAVRIQSNYEPVSQDSIEQVIREIPEVSPPVNGVLETAHLEASMQIIFRIEILLKIPRSLWDIPAVHDEADEKKLVIVDFPGLGNNSTDLRDSYLFKREFQEIHTLLVLITKDSIIHDRGATGRSILNNLRDRFAGSAEDISKRTLVVLSRFGEMPVAKLSGKENTRHLDNLLKKENLGWDDVWDELDLFKQMLTEASDITANSRICFMAQDITLKYLKNTYPDKVRIELPFVSESGRIVQEEFLQKWKDLVERLPEDEWKDPLVAFTEDGGLKYLKSLISRQVRNYGILQINADAVSEAKELVKLMVELSKDIEYDPETQRNIDDVRQQIENLEKIYHSGRLGSRVNGNNQSSETNLNLFYSPDKSPGERVSLINYVRDEVADRIFMWEQWYELFDNLRDGRIQFPESERKAPDKKRLFEIMQRTVGKTLTEEKIWELVNADSEDDFDEQNKIVKNANDLFPVFQMTFDNLNKVVRNSFQAALNQYLDEWRDNPETISIEESLYDLTNSLTAYFFSAEPAAKKKARAFSLNLGQVLPSQVVEELKSEIEEFFNNFPDDKQAKDIFPLALADENHQLGTTFLWERERLNGEGNAANHLYHILRLRDEIIVRTEQHFLQQANTLLSDISRLLTVKLRDVSALLKDSNRYGDIMTAAVKHTTDPSTSSDWKATVQNMVNTSIPEWLKKNQERN